MADDDKTPVKPVASDANVPDWQHALWKQAVDLKAWIRRELAHAASGLSEKERSEKNP